MVDQDAWNARIWQEFKAKNLTRAYRDVLLALVTFQGARGVYPSQETLAAVAGCSDRTVRRALVMAATLGLAWWLPRGPHKGRRETNRYVLNVPERPVQPGMRPPWPKRSTGQNGRRQAQIEREKATQAMIREASGAGDLLAARRAAFLARQRAALAGPYR